MINGLVSILPMLASCSDKRHDPQVISCSLIRSEAPWDLNLDFDVSKIPLCEVIIEVYSEILRKHHDRILVIRKSVNQCPDFSPFWSAPLSGFRLLQRILTYGKTDDIVRRIEQIVAIISLIVHYFVIIVNSIIIFIGELTAALWKQNWSATIFVESENAPKVW